MEEEATQPSTQPRVDPRRHGSSSMLSVEDEADVVCILHPATPAAYEATKLIAKYCPQHILQNHGLSYNLDYEGIEEAPTTEPKVDDNDLDYSQTGDVRGMDMPESSPRDIALRFSSRVHDMCMGWSFGRNPLKCDLPIVGSNETLKISNRHFRIYLNTYGVLMLEDTSTNGTWVDHNHLQMKPGHAGQKSRRTIQQGSMIEILLSAPDPCMRFIVNIPSRDRGEAKYNQKLGEYMALVKQLDGQARVVAEGAATGNVMAPPAVFPNSRLPKDELLTFGPGTTIRSCTASSLSNCSKHFCPSFVVQSRHGGMERWRHVQCRRSDRQRCFCNRLQARDEARWGAVRRQRD